MLFGVLLSLLPLIAAYLGAAFFGHTPGFVEFLSRGDLLLVSATVSGVAIGELFGSQGRTAGGLEVFMGGIAFAVALLSALLFGLITTAESQGQHPAEAIAATWTAILFVLSVASGAGCVALSER
jgi:hypothetical protein